MTMKTDVDKIRALMRKNSTTQKELAQYLGCSERAMSFYLTEKWELKISQLGRIAEYYKVQIDELIVSA